MKILIVEDQDQKYEIVRSFLNEIDVGKQIDIERVRSFVGSLELTKDTPYDLVVLDILVPWTDDVEVDENAAFEILKKLYNAERENSPKFVVGLTQENSILEKSINEFRKYGWNVYDFSQEIEWKLSIKNIIERLVRIREQESVDYAIVCALRDPELKAWETVLPDVFRLDEEALDCNLVWRAEIRDSIGRTVSCVATCPRHMGLPAASCLTTLVLSKFRPKVLIMTGITGGVRGKVNFGDILIAAPSWDYGSGKITNSVDPISGMEKEDFIPATNEIPLRAWTQKVLQGLAESTNWKSTLIDGPDGLSKEAVEVHFGPVASGVQVVATSTIPALLAQRNRKVIGIEMETYGLYYAAVNTSVSSPVFFSCKSVSDFADEGKNDQFRSWASEVSAHFAFSVIESGKLLK